MTHELMLFNPDHSFWKSIPLTVPPNTLFSHVRHISESKINADDNIEIAYSSGYYEDSCTSLSYVTKVISENGNQILSIDGSYDILLSEIAGLPNKFIVDSTVQTTTVYDFSGNLEHFYSEGITRRVKLEFSGEKYHVIDKPNGNLRLLNANHSLWKTIPPFKPATALYGFCTLIAEAKVNSDPLLEIAYYFQQTSNNYHESRFVNENGNLLLSVPNCSAIYYHHLDG